MQTNGCQICITPKNRGGPWRRRGPSEDLPGKLHKKEQIKLSTSLSQGSVIPEMSAKPNVVVALHACDMLLKC